jgi:DNA-binding NtrC family response regulator
MARRVLGLGPVRSDAMSKTTEHEERETDLRARLRRHEVELIIEALRQARWNQTEAARLLGLPRRTLVHKLKALGIAKLGYGESEPR